VSAPTVERTGVDGPGVYDLPADVYHADPVPGGSLSSTGARKLLQTCPAIFDWERRNPTPYKKVFEFGGAAHKVVLGTGPELVVIEGTGKAGPEVWAKDDDKAAVAAVRRAGGIPLKPSEYAQVQAMAKALREHPVAAALLRPEGGTPEQSLIWSDGTTGVSCRAMLDWLPESARGRMIVADYKTSLSANPEDFRRSVHSYGYHQQADHYLDGVRALGLDPDPAFVFVVQMKTAPYLVSLVTLDDRALQIGAERNRRAREIYARCTATGRWPGWTDGEVAEISLPVWAERQHDFDSIPDFAEEPV